MILRQAARPAKPLERFSMFNIPKQQPTSGQRLPIINAGKSKNCGQNRHDGKTAAG
jgi:hypothetical protein